MPTRTKKKTTVLIILDGWGVAKLNKANPITPAAAPHYFAWLKNYPSTTLAASGAAVGLFPDQEGNSEAGHLNLGAGRVVKQDALYVSDAITDGTFFKNHAFREAVYHAKKYHTAVHIMGLLSNHNSAHSCPEHLYALLDFLHREQTEKVYLHLFTDGRDSGRHDAPTHLHNLEKHLHGNEQIVSIMGRWYGMDRNKNWERTRLAYEAMVQGRGLKAKTAAEALTMAYDRGETDEFIQPTVILNKAKAPVKFQNNDVMFFFNLRSDRARQITKAFVQPHFETENLDAFRRSRVAKNTRFVAMTDFGPDLPGVFIAFPSRDVEKSIVQVLCPRRQLYVAEGEKFAHVTYFFNGGYADPLCNEERVKIPSATVTNFADKPEMETKKIAERVCRGIASGKYDFIVANFANADMVGHTGNFAAAVKAITVIDNALAQVLATMNTCGAQGAITADHGNAEEMINLATGEIDSEHSTYPVPFILIGPEFYRRRFVYRLRSGGKLADVAPTLLKMMHVPQPECMTGKALF